jgi:hypothetical protein
MGIEICEPGLHCRVVGEELGRRVTRSRDAAVDPEQFADVLVWPTEEIVGVGLGGEDSDIRDRKSTRLQRGRQSLVGDGARSG